MAMQVWSWFLPAWNNIIEKNTEAGTGVLYSGTTGEVYQPNRGGAGTRQSPSTCPGRQHSVGIWHVSHSHASASHAHIHASWQSWHTVAACADFIVDYTQVTALSASVFNVVLVRNPYATVYAGDITAVRAPCPSPPCVRHDTNLYRAESTQSLLKASVLSPAPSDS